MKEYTLTSKSLIKLFFNNANIVNPHEMFVTKFNNDQCLVFTTNKSLSLQINEQANSLNQNVANSCISNQKEAQQFVNDVMHKYSSMQLFIKPHFVDETIYEPIKGTSTLVLSQDCNVKPYLNTLVDFHTIPGINDFGIDSKNFFCLYSIVAHSIIDGKYCGNYAGIYTTSETSRDTAIQVLSQQINHKHSHNRQQQTTFHSIEHEI